MTLTELAEELGQEHARLARRAAWLRGAALFCIFLGWGLAGMGISGFAWILALASVLLVASWFGSGRWRDLLVALGPELAEVENVNEVGALLEVARCLELAPILPGVGPDGTRHWPATDRQRATLAALARLLPRLDEAQATALRPMQRRWLVGTLERIGERPDSSVGKELLIAGLLTLGTARDNQVRTAARGLRNHVEPRVRLAAVECLAALERD